MPLIKMILYGIKQHINIYIPCDLDGESNFGFDYMDHDPTHLLGWTGRIHLLDTPNSHQIISHSLNSHLLSFGFVNRVLENDE